MHPDNAIRSGHGPAFNALKHGGYAEAILLPGDDAAAFRRERRALFHNYRPQTQDEADLVEAMAEHRWVARRFRPVQAWFDGQAVTPSTDAAGRVCEPIAHQRLHSGMDVTLQRQRIENLWHRARARLVLMQNLRRQGLVAGAVALPKDCYLETDGRVYGPVARQVIVPLPEPDIDADGMEAGHSPDRENGKYQEQQETGTQAAPAGAPDAPATPVRSTAGGLGGGELPPLAWQGVLPAGYGRATAVPPRQGRGF